jgi:hypothetical protein
MAIKCSDIDFAKLAKEIKSKVHGKYNNLYTIVREILGIKEWGDEEIKIIDILTKCDSEINKMSHNHNELLVDNVLITMEVEHQNHINKSAIQLKQIAEMQNSITY